mgnify:CR=1 FL=1
MNKYDDTYAQTIINTYGNSKPFKEGGIAKAYVNLHFEDGAIVSYELIDEEKYAQLAPEEMIETMSLPSESPFAS